MLLQCPIKFYLLKVLFDQNFKIISFLGVLEVVFYFYFKLFFFS